jgi:hypothetical protein
VGVPEVRERRAHRVEHREDLERQEEQRPGDQVLGRDPARGEIHPEDHRRDGDEQGQAQPLLLLDQGEGAEDGDGQHQAEQGDLDDHAGRGGASRPAARAGRSGAGARGDAGLDGCLGLRHVGLPT